MRSKIMVPLLAVSYVAATALTYLTFRRYPDQSSAAAMQWLLFYVVTVIYPAVWTMQELRLLRKLGLQDSDPLVRHSWAPVIVGASCWIAGLALVFPLLR
jgi:hypothetical protein